MKLTLLLLAVTASYVMCARVPHTTPDPRPLDQRVKQLEDILEGLTRQVMLQQYYVEEKTRSDGNSGLKKIRLTKDGTKNYHETAHIDRRFMACHDHPNYDRTVGLGELLATMNGVEFRTRHNDYKLRMPHPTDQGYNKIVDIPFPNVPQSVLNKKTLNEQILEMRQYFKAFNEQNPSIRNYKPYFKPNLCYLEGGWTTGANDFSEPFQSDRHQIDASSWFDLMDKMRYTSYTGSKSVLENFALLPTTINNVEGGVPHYAQWNYRILCHPLKDDLPTKAFRVQDDLLYRFPNRLGMDKVVDTRAQRFYMNERSQDHYDSGRSIMDDLMMQVPGKNNYPGELHDNSFDMVMEDVRYNNHTLVNTAYYHRWFKTLDKGAMGIKSIHRGFSDANLWVAQTDHPQIAPMSVNHCRKVNRVKVCGNWTTRYTYAIPLEVVYTSPLIKWNPYDLPVYPVPTVTAKATRNGQQDAAKAYNGTNPLKFHYWTPSEFYSSGPRGPKDPADTAKKGAGVLDKNGQLRVVESAGTRIVTPNIEGVGMVRLRYPIVPIHGEGTGVWKELNALKDMTMHMNRYASLFEERPGQIGGGANGTGYQDGTVHFKLSEVVQDPPGQHSHDFVINEEEFDELKRPNNGKTHLLVTTSEDQGHSHDLEIRWRPGGRHLAIFKCDGQQATDNRTPVCWDGHLPGLIQIK